MPGQYAGVPHALRQIAVEHVEIELARCLARGQPVKDAANGLAQPFGAHQHAVGAVWVAGGVGSQPGGLFWGYEACLFGEGDQVSVGVEVIAI
jgi:hypothetical protein